MPTLHDTTELTKNIVKWGGIGITSIIILVFLVRGSIVVYKSIFPDTLPEPEAKFGVIPQIQFPLNKYTNDYTYVLDTVSGNLPTFPDRADVYETFVPVPNLLNLRNTRAKLATVDFILNETRITDTVYSWNDRTNRDKKITYNIVSNDFSIVSNYLSDPFLRNQQGSPPSNVAINLAIEFLESLELFPLDFDEKLTTTQYLTLQNNETFPATSISTGMITRVDIFQKAINKIPIVYPSPPFSSLYFLISKLGSQDTIIESSFNHQRVTEISSPYPLKTIQTAFEELKRGKGYIAAYYGTNKEISIKEVYLAYYMSDAKQQYLQPIYVFEGKNGFFGYVPAIVETKLQK